MKKLKFLVLFPVCFAITFFSCKDQNVTASATDIADTVESVIFLEEGYHSVTDKYFDYYFKDNGNSVRGDVVEFIIRASNSQSSENEFGVIKAANGKAQNVENACRNYLESRKAAYLDAKAAYSPDEYEKYKDARIIRFGDTIVYFILSAKDAKKAESSLNELLK